ncbi:MAG: hypothetical protein WDM88_03395 [Galbitalea sp.]
MPAWEQDTAAAGVAHLLALLLDDAGWGVMWRTGRSRPLRTGAPPARTRRQRGAARLALCRRQRPPDSKPDARRQFDAAPFLSSL